MKKILLLSDFAREPDRQTIRGITNYKENNESWLMHSVPPSVRSDPDEIRNVLKLAKQLEVDAIFGAWPAIENEERPDIGIPIILKPYNIKVNDFTIFFSNSEEIGKMAADFFNAIGITNLSFSGIPKRIWSTERERYFKKYAHGTFFKGFHFSETQTDYKRIAFWLRQLPKPVGILCCNDVNAHMLIEICVSEGIRIPEDIAILGIDDDEFLCNITSPSISSIKLDYESAGYKLASRIVEAVDNGIECSDIRHSPVCIVERQSTPKKAKMDIYVSKIIEYMQAHYAEGIGIPDTIADIPLSRRSIEMRFRKEFGKMTMHKYLTQLKVSRMKELLLTTDSNVFSIAIESGFSESENIFRIFRKYAGCTPLEFRKSHLKN